MSCETTVFEVPHSDTWDAVLQIVDLATNDVLPLDDSTALMRVYDDRGRLIAETDVLVNESDDELTVILAPAFWAHFGTVDKIKEETYRARFVITTGEVVTTYPNEANYIPFKVS